MVLLPSAPQEPLPLRNDTAVMVKPAGRVSLTVAPAEFTGELLLNVMSWNVLAAPVAVLTLKIVPLPQSTVPAFWPQTGAVDEPVADELVVMNSRLPGMVSRMPIGLIVLPVLFVKVTV